MQAKLKSVGKKLLPHALLSMYGRFVSTPHYITNRFTFALRRAFSPYFLLPCWVTSTTGSRFYLSKDPVDDWILYDVLDSLTELYFPPELDQLPADMLMLDVGAHHGFIAVELLRRYPQAHLIAVEPNPMAVRLLKKNLQANSLLGRVDIIEAGISQQSGWGQLKLDESGSWGDSLTNDLIGINDKSISVQTLTVNDILNGSQPRFVKSNAEGAEFSLFPQLFVESIFPEIIILLAHPEHGAVDDLLAECKSNGYIMRDVGSSPDFPRLHGIRLKDSE